ncbi:MAG: ABC transporter substrate-binding protein [Betaproteobacteria bacterium]|nr:ABC transporter substrate-binding protein [Betaproteobacteria bacterium]
MSQARRRQFLIASGALLVAPLARAQQSGNVRRVGILVTNLRGGTQYIDAMKAGLRERGWIEGKNLAIDLRDPDGNSDLFPRLAAELVAAKPDVIFATSYLAVLAVTDETNAIPVVFAAISDPVKAGLVKSLARPGGQLTGVALGAVPLAGKRMEILKDTLPRLKRVAVLYDSDRQGEAGLDEVRDAAARLGVTLIAVGAGSGEEIERAFAEMRTRNAEALLVPGSIRFFIERGRIIALAQRYRLPAIYEFLDMVDQGGLIAYGPDYQTGFRRVAYYVDRILRGTRPGDLPIEEAMRYGLVINLKTARALGVTIPQIVLYRADRVIE